MTMNSRIAKYTFLKGMPDQQQGRGTLTKKGKVKWKTKAQGLGKEEEATTRIMTPNVKNNQSGASTLTRCQARHHSECGNIN
ncbi:uncharacterized protein G2W53_018152 [Senna tora]|uniref:Uncharacterized protein n=1 Tax=Senna tora TaxID=362788 RepID=A0A834TRH4_9FABA|nr:uncharacterized protein G2W53_018152 [Senna tora]